MGDGAGQFSELDIWHSFQLEHDMQITLAKKSSCSIFQFKISRDISSFFAMATINVMVVAHERVVNNTVKDMMMEIKSTDTVGSLKETVFSESGYSVDYLVMFHSVSEDNEYDHLDDSLQLCFTHVWEQKLAIVHYYPDMVKVEVVYGYARGTRTRNGDVSIGRGATIHDFLVAVSRHFYGDELMRNGQTITAEEGARLMAVIHDEEVQDPATPILNSFLAFNRSGVNVRYFVDNAEMRLFDRFLDARRHGTNLGYDNEEQNDMDNILSNEFNELTVQVIDMMKNGDNENETLNSASLDDLRHAHEKLTELLEPTLGLWKQVSDIISHRQGTESLPVLKLNDAVITFPVAQPEDEPEDDVSTTDAPAPSSTDAPAPSSQEAPSSSADKVEVNLGGGYKVALKFEKNDGSFIIDEIVIIENDTVGQSKSKMLKKFGYMAQEAYKKMIFLVNEEPIQNNRKASKNVFPSGCTVLIKKQGLTGGVRSYKPVQKDKEEKAKGYKTSIGELAGLVDRELLAPLPFMSGIEEMLNTFVANLEADPEKTFLGCLSKLTINEIDEMFTEVSQKGGTTEVKISKVAPRILGLKLVIDSQKSLENVVGSAEAIIHLALNKLSGSGSEILAVKKLLEKAKFIKQVQMSAGGGASNDANMG